MICMINWIKKLFKKKETPKPKSTVVEWVDEKGVRHAKYTIDVSELSFKNKEKTLGELMSLYKEDVKLESIGELTINGTASLPYNKQIWFPQ